MKAVLEFALPDDEIDFRLAQRGSAYWSALWDFAQELRRWGKNGKERITLDELEAAWAEATTGVDWTEIP